LVTHFDISVFLLHSTETVSIAPFLCFIQFPCICVEFQCLSLSLSCFCLLSFGFDHSIAYRHFHKARLQSSSCLASLCALLLLCSLSLLFVLLLGHRNPAKHFNFPFSSFFVRGSKHLLKHPSSSQTMAQTLDESYLGKPMSFDLHALSCTTGHECRAS
jgi:hypothetical protein